MENQEEPDEVAVRLVTIDSYMADPHPDLDATYSHFQRKALFKPYVTTYAQHSACLVKASHMQALSSSSSFGSPHHHLLALPLSRVREGLPAGASGPHLRRHGGREEGLRPHTQGKDSTEGTLLPSLGSNRPLPSGLITLSSP